MPVNREKDRFLLICTVSHCKLHCAECGIDAEQRHTLHTGELSTHQRRDGQQPITSSITGSSSTRLELIPNRVAL